MHGNFCENLERKKVFWAQTVVRQATWERHEKNNKMAEKKQKVDSNIGNDITKVFMKLTQKHVNLLKNVFHFLQKNFWSWAEV